MSPRRPTLARRAANIAYVAGTARLERRLPYWPLARIERLQGRRVRSIVAHAYETVPFYRRAMDERGLRPGDVCSADDLAALPIVDARTIRERAEDFASRAYDDGSRETFFTSGSESGIRRTIYWDSSHVLRGLATAERDRLILTRLAGERRVQTMLRELVGESVGGRLLRRITGDAAEHQRISIFPGDSASRTMRVIWSDQTLIPAHPPHHHFLRPQMPFELVAERMDEIRPRIAFSFGSYADQFFRWLADRGARIALPRVWMYTGDRLSPEGRRLAEERFGCLVYSVYSAMEAHRMGIQCERREGFHLNVDLFDVRLVDEEGASVPPGEPGDIVVSNLANRAMVLLNYRIGDRGVLDPSPCPCGRTLPLLATLEGRRSEVLRLSDGREISSLSVESAFSDELSSALEVQFVQRADGELEWRIVPFERVDPVELEARVEEKARRVFGNGTRIALEFVDAIPRTAQGKFLKVVREPARERSGAR